ncbi:bifunctional homocysteine S-methyltransferase/methylenetetrahydrofolate reductase [Thermoactinomyces mirandus]|uniref:Bifunctional homocysteine S-methyltransferase/methylenetetrahydrofolate reductase n=1 Tax=Thermoactinomyces mirandus TaxID=2756294 RepID=A0A7W1XRU6_9BACL|nr:bifunctional homocysteine S-methyltransferase/methylenetetrahydrofolate reductase [Thermoactinomyces mirandus]MBA4602157.1 bifunctional homocysteine S-methyltransferase/methylenetetrahydrofolate reductase [Thermoactinomyces mirandus]
MSKPELLHRLQDSLLVGDGAISTYLYQQGVSVGHCSEELVLSNPSLVSDVHQAYYEAGARVIETHTYGANRERLTRYGLETRVTRLNREAVRIARESVGSDAYVVGAIGSICAGRVPVYDKEEYRGMYEEQAIALLHAGVDGILLETFLDLKEILLAVEVIRPLTPLPIFAQLSMIELGRTRDAFTLSEAFAQLAEKGVNGVGINCRLGPVEVLRTLEKTIVPGDLIITAYPNAGRLGMSNGELHYKSTPDYFEETAELLVRQGVRLLGGCCGTTPEHIARIAMVLRDMTPVERENPSSDGWKIPPVETIVVQKRKKPTVVEQVRKKRTIICELDPPRDLDISRYLEGARRLQQAGVDAITLADNSLATARMSNLALGAILKKYGIEPLAHVACRDRNLLGQQSHLMGLHALGIDQILVITGDPSRMGDLPGASSIYDVTSIELTRMVKQFNEGISFSGRELKQKAGFVVGTAFNPHVRKLDAALKRLEKKIEAGADFVMTQPVYDPDGMLEVHEVTKSLPVPVFIGIMPLTGYRNALFLHHEVPGIKIPDQVLKRMEKTTDRLSGQREGMQVAKELLKVAMEKFAGIYLITPFSNWHMTEELTRFVREHDRQLLEHYHHA